ncbi:hypothetical protein [Candidatus Neptunochlamydia vexilliferae]|uniref:hypothetical protein n=1 Tax=Candidatus Neptunichlamydia vexilliferae TaxID=1651774 RepID=UPI00189106F2|nr:hypothetical protein [Candidatus Neptunochlamydia vexilliferae]
MNSPVEACSPLRLWEEKESIWDFLSYENLSYDSVLALIDTIENGKGSEIWEINEVISFITFLARNGIVEGDIAAKEELEQDIADLLEDESFTYWEGEQWSVKPAVYSGEKPHLMTCGWLSKKWKKTKRFVKKHKKAIIVAAVVVVVATVVIVATGGSGTGPAVAGAAGAIGAANGFERPRVNKPGEVGYEAKKEPIAKNPPVEETVKKHIFAVKETLTDELPNAAMNIPLTEEGTFWKEAVDRKKNTVSWIAHDAIKETGKLIGAPEETTYNYHEKIDGILGTDFSSQFSPEVLAKQPDIIRGEVPIPIGGIVGASGRVAAAARAAGIIGGAAAIGNALTQPTHVMSPTQDISIEMLAEAGKVRDRGGLTKAGRALQKHGARPDTVFPNPSGSVSETNAHGQEVLESILNHPDKKVVSNNLARHGNVIEVHAPGIGGVRYNEGRTPAKSKSYPCQPGKCTERIN